MIVRINQIDPKSAESATLWDPDPVAGPIQTTWPPRSFTYQILVLEQDESNHPLAVQFRQKQMRQLIPQVLLALAEPNDKTVLRCDGLLTKAELLPVLNFAIDLEKTDRYSISATTKFSDEPEPMMSSIRLLMHHSKAGEFFANELIGFERSVRLRAFAIGADIVNPLLDIADIDDERWREILPAASFALSTGKELSSLVIWTTRHNPADAKRRIMERLGGKKREPNPA